MNKNEGVDTNKYENLENLTKKNEHLVQSVPKGNQKGTNGHQKRPKGSQRTPKGSQRAPKGSQKQPKGTQKGAKGNQRTTKWIKKSLLGKRVPNVRAHHTEMVEFWNQFGS